MVSWLSGMSRSRRIAHVGDGLGAGADHEEGVAAADDGLIRVVGVEVQAATAENLGEDVAGGGDTLAGSAADADGKRVTHIRSRRRTGLWFEMVLDSTTPTFEVAADGMSELNQNTTASGRFDRGAVRQRGSGPEGVEEEFVIAFSAGDGRVDDFEFGAADLLDAGADAIDGELMGSGVADDAAFADAFAAGFELRLDENDGFDSVAGAWRIA